MSIPRLQPAHRGCKACRSRHGRASMERERVADLQRKLVHAQAYADDHPETMPRVLKIAAKLKAAVARANHAAEDYEAHRAVHPAWDDVDDPWKHESNPRHAPMPGGSELAAMILAGETIAELAETFGRKPSTIREVLNRDGYRANGQPMQQTNDDGLPHLDRPYEAPAWMLDANCTSTDPELFFPGKGGSTRPAKKICSSCPVTTECLEYALQIGDRDGVWGGTAPRARRHLTAARGAS